MKTLTNTILKTTLIVLPAFGFFACDNDEDMDMPENDVASLFVSSNTSGMITVMDFSSSDVSSSTFASAGADADGIYARWRPSNPT